jgi:hypothetical protein
MTLEDYDRIIRLEQIIISHGYGPTLDTQRNELSCDQIDAICKRKPIDQAPRKGDKCPYCVHGVVDARIYLPGGRMEIIAWCAGIPIVQCASSCGWTDAYGDFPVPSMGYDKQEITDNDSKHE